MRNKVPIPFSVGVVLALLSTPVLADAGWDDVGNLFVAVTCLILVPATVATIFATRKAALWATLLVAAVPACILANEVLDSRVLDIWAFFLLCFVLVVIACACRLWRLRKPRSATAA